MSGATDEAANGRASPRPDPVIEAYKKDLDRTLLRENLKLSVEERLLKLSRFQHFLEEVGSAGRRRKP